MIAMTIDIDIPEISKTDLKHLEAAQETQNSKCKLFFDDTF